MMKILEIKQTGPNNYDKTYRICPHGGCNNDFDSCGDEIILRFHKGCWYAISPNTGLEIDPTLKDTFKGG